MSEKKAVSGTKATTAAAEPLDPEVERLLRLILQARRQAGDGKQTPEGTAETARAAA